MATWRVLVAETVTGTILAQVFPSAAPAFTRQICGKGEWSVSLVVDDEYNRLVDLRAYATSNRFSWIVDCDGTICQAGPVTSYAFDDQDRSLTVTGGGLGHIFDQRPVRNTTGDPGGIAGQDNDLTLTQGDLSSILRRLVVNVVAGEGPSYALPLNVDQTYTPGDAHTRTYHGYDLASLWSRMIDLSDVLDGPEFELRPQYFPFEGDTILAWSLDVGSPLLGDQDYPGVWDYGAALESITVDGNASVGPVFRAWSKGSGAEHDTIVGYAENVDALAAVGYPGTDYVDTDHTSVEKQDTADAHAASALREHASPVETWSVSVRIDGLTNNGTPVSPGLASWSLGDRPLFRISGHPWLRDQASRKRIVGFSSDTADTVKLQLAEFPAKL